MSESIKAQCDELFMACAPFVRIERETADRLDAARAELKAARAAFRSAENDAAAVRRVWVENILTHDHRTICLGRRPDEPATTAAGE